MSNRALGIGPFPNYHADLISAKMNAIEQLKYLRIQDYIKLKCYIAEYVNFQYLS